MNWREVIDLEHENNLNLLTEIENKRMANLERKYKEAATAMEKLSIEKEILKLYLQAIERNKPKKKTLGDWLDPIEKNRIESLRKQIPSHPYYYEALIYQVYLESICRQTQYPKEMDVMQLIHQMQETDSSEEAEQLAKSILQLLSEA